MVLVPLPTRQRLFNGGGDFVAVAAVVNSEKVVAGGRVIETESVVVLSSVQLPPSISVASGFSFLKETWRSKERDEREREREGSERRERIWVLVWIVLTKRKEVWE